MAGASLWCSVGLLWVVGCSPAPSHSDPGGSQRSRDSALGASTLPGAQGVRGALRASDSAEVRNARLDSLANQR
jgi:hypothetical protein